MWYDNDTLIQNDGFPNWFNVNFGTGIDPMLFLKLLSCVPVSFINACTIDIYHSERKDTSFYGDSWE